MTGDTGARVPDNADVYAPGRVIPAAITGGPGRGETWRARSQEMLPLGRVIIRMRDEDPPRYRHALVTHISATLITPGGGGPTCAACLIPTDPPEETRS